MFNGYVPYITDTETTGMDPEKHEIIEYSSCRLRIESAKNIIKEQKTWCIKPINVKDIDKGALAVNNHKLEDLLHQTEYGRETYRPLDEVIPEIELWMSEDDVSVIDRLLVGQNIKTFDMPFIKNAWKKSGSLETLPFDFERDRCALDTLDIVKFIDLCSGKRRKFMNLSALVKDFHIKKAKAHRAEGDVQMTTDLLIKILEVGFDVFGGRFDDCYGSE